MLYLLCFFSINQSGYNADYITHVENFSKQIPFVHFLYENKTTWPILYFVWHVFFYELSLGMMCVSCYVSSRHGRCHTQWEKLKFINDQRLSSNSKLSREMWYFDVQFVSPMTIYYCFTFSDAITQLCYYRSPTSISLDIS